MRAKSKKPAKNSSKKIDDFISGANYADLDKEKSIFPWENLTTSNQKSRKLTIRIPEEYALKLDFLSKHSTPKLVKQRFILENIIPLIDAEIEKHKA